MMKKCFNTILRLEINEKNSGKTVEQILKKEFDISSDSNNKFVVVPKLIELWSNTIA